MKLCYLYTVKKLFRMNSAIVTGLLIPLAGTALGIAIQNVPEGTIGFALGFALMMVLDVLLG